MTGLDRDVAADTGTQERRDAVIVRTSVIGIVANVFLAGFKAAVGIVTNSIAVTLDAVNNLSDVLSSVITIGGTKLASRGPDKKHPLGHGRVEYLSAMAVAIIILYAGLTSLVESVKKIISPVEVHYTGSSLLIIASAVIVKLILGSYVKKTGKRVNSGSLIASGSDALFDAILSFSVLMSAVVYLKWGIGLEAYVGVAISAFIIKSGVEMLLDPVDEILGKRFDTDYLKEIKQTICEDEYVMGAFDLILHSYGPERYVGSVHVEVPDTMTADEIDAMERRIMQRVLERHGVIMTGIGIYSMNTQNDEIKAMRSAMTHIIMGHEGVLQMHGFYVDLEKKVVGFDIIIDLELKNREEMFAHIRDELGDLYPDFQFSITMDIDV